MSFLPHYCHSFRITVIPSGLLSFLPYYCHSFRISVIPSKYCHSFLIITISKYLSSWIAPVLSHTRRARKMATGGGHICECIVNFPKFIETISIFWSLIFQNLVLMVLKFWKVKYLVLIKEVLMRWYCSRCILMKYLGWFIISVALWVFCKDRTVQCYECIGCPASELIGCNIFFLHR